MNYTIKVKGRTYSFSTMERAIEVAAEIFKQTGIVVGIVAELA